MKITMKIKKNKIRKRTVTILKTKKNKCLKAQNTLVYLLF